MPTSANERRKERTDGVMIRGRRKKQQEGGEIGGDRWSSKAAVADGRKVDFGFGHVIQPNLNHKKRRLYRFET